MDMTAIRQNLDRWVAGDAAYLPPKVKGGEPRLRYDWVTLAGMGYRFPWMHSKDEGDDPALYSDGPSGVAFLPAESVEAVPDLAKPKNSSYAATGHAIPRCIPVAFLPVSLEEKWAVTRDLVQLTHSSVVVRLAAQLYVAALHCALTTVERAKASDIVKEAYRLMDERRDYSGGDVEVWKYFSLLGRDRVMSPQFSFTDDGYAVSVVGAAFSAVASAMSPFYTPRSIYAVQIAGDIGGQAHLTGALAGALAGALYGLDDWPKKWVKSFDALPGVRDRVDRFDAACRLEGAVGADSGGGLDGLFG